MFTQGDNKWLLNYNKEYGTSSLEKHVFNKHLGKYNIGEYRRQGLPCPN
jgi:hypothetical protein